MIKQEVIRLIQAMKDNGLTYEHIGAAIGYTAFTIRAWHLGHRVPKIPVIVMLQNMLKKTKQIQKPI